MRRHRGHAQHVGVRQGCVRHPEKDKVSEEDPSQSLSSGTLQTFIRGGEGKFSHFLPADAVFSAGSSSAHWGRVFDIFVSVFLLSSYSTSFLPPPLLPVEMISQAS